MLSPPPFSPQNNVGTKAVQTNQEGVWIFPDIVWGEGAAIECFKNATGEREVTFRTGVKDMAWMGSAVICVLSDYFSFTVACKTTR